MVVRLQSNARLQINSASIQLADEEEISMQKLCDLAAKKTYTIFATQISKHGVVVQNTCLSRRGSRVRVPSIPQRREHSESRALFLYRSLSHLDNLRCYLLQGYSSLLLALTDVWGGGVFWDNKLTLRR